jgi:hypothetical protein
MTTQTNLVGGFNTAMPAAENTNTASAPRALAT